MVSTPCHCSGIADKMCNIFLPAKDKDSHMLCNICKCKSCNAEGRCSDCHDRTDEK